MEGNEEIRSEEFKEILKSSAPWIQKHGISLIALLFCYLLFICSKFSYSEIITLPIILRNDTINSDEGGYLYNRKNGMKEYWGGYITVSDQISKSIHKGQEVYITFESKLSIANGISKGYIKDIIVTENENNMSIIRVILRSENGTFIHAKSISCITGKVRINIGSSSVFHKIMMPMKTLIFPSLRSEYHDI